MKPTKNFYALLDTNFKIFGLEGATWSSKTYSAMQYLDFLYGEKLENSKVKEVCHIFAETIPVLNEGMITDFKNILIENGHWNVRNWNSTNRIYKFNGHKIRFLAIDRASKAHSARRDRMVTDESQNLNWEIVSQLMGRTKKQIIHCFNPTHEFWYHKEIQNNDFYKGMVKHVHSTMFDNIDNIPEMTLRIILGRAEKDKYYRDVYVYGKKGVKKGVIFNNWDQVDELPVNYAWLVYGLDFGFANDPTALMEMRFADGELWIREIIYEPGLLNIPNIQNKANIVQRMQERGVPENAEIYADIAEQKSIAEISAYFPNIQAHVKNPIEFGIQLLKQYKIHFLKTSVNMIKEARNYMWKLDKVGDPLNAPIDNWNHGWDGIRYEAEEKLNALDNTPIIMNSEW